MSKVIILNGPPGSGKDTLADLIEERDGFVHMKFKDRLYEIGAKIAELPLGGYKWLCTDRSTKELGTFVLGGKSPREHLIWVSEEVIKPLFGEDYFGKYLDLQAYEPLEDGNNVVVSDSGFVKELEPLAYNCSWEGVSIHVIRLHRGGYSFEGDSREYIYPEDSLEWWDDVDFHDLILVDGEVEEAYKAIEALVGGF